MRPLADLELQLAAVKEAQKQIDNDLSLKNFQGQLIFKADSKTVDSLTVDALITVLTPLLPAIKSMVQEELKKNHDTVISQLQIEFEKLLPDDII